MSLNVNNIDKNNNNNQLTPFREINNTQNNIEKYQPSNTTQIAKRTLDNSNDVVETKSKKLKNDKIETLSISDLPNETILHLHKILGSACNSFDLMRLASTDKKQCLLAKQTIIDSLNQGKAFYEVTPYWPNLSGIKEFCNFLGKECCKKIKKFIFPPFVATFTRRSEGSETFKIEDLEEISHLLPNLTTLYFGGTDETKELLQMLYKCYPNLTSLHLHGTINDENIQQLKKFTFLKSLYINGSLHISRTTFKDMPCLKDLSLINKQPLTTASIRELPETLENCKFEGVHFYEFKNLSALKKIEFVKCAAVDSFDFKLMDQLEELSTEDCLGQFHFIKNDNLKILKTHKSKKCELPLEFIDFFPNLEELHLSGFQPIFNFKSPKDRLRVLKLENCSKIENFNAKNFKNLEELFLNNSKLESLHFLSDLNELKILKINFPEYYVEDELGYFIVDLPHNQDKLHTLQLSNCVFDDLKFIKNFPQLKNFDFSSSWINGKDADYKAIASCKELETLKFYDNNIKGSDLSMILKELPNLKVLDINKCEEIKYFLPPNHIGIMRINGMNTYDDNNPNASWKKVNRIETKL